MHVSAIDAPSDQYGAVTDVSRPLIYKLNQASMQQSTYDALLALMLWAVTQLEGPVKESLHAHQVNEGILPPQAPTPVAQENAPTETPVAPLSPAPEGNALTEEPKSLVGAPEASVADAVPLTADMLDETPEDAALEAEVDAAVSADAETTTEEPVVEATTTTRIAKPT